MGWDILQWSYFVSFIYFLMDLGPVKMVSPRVFTTAWDKSSGVGVSPCTESAKRLLIED
jgi:hypothetical protein